MDEAKKTEGEEVNSDSPSLSPKHGSHTTSKLRILLVDDNPGFLKTASQFLSQHSGVEVVGRAESGPEAIRKVKELAPDLVLMDLRMPQMNGIEATRRIKAQPNSPRVIILTLQHGLDYTLAAQEAGADGLIPKDDFAKSLPPLVTSYTSTLIQYFEERPRNLS